MENFKGKIVNRKIKKLYQVIWQVTLGWSKGHLQCENVVKHIVSLNLLGGNVDILLSKCINYFYEGK